MGACALAATAHEVSVVGSFTYVTDDWGLRVIDVSDPTDPIEGVSRNPTKGRASGLALMGEHAFLACDIGGLRIFDISEPTLPLEISVHLTEAARSVSLEGTYAFLADDIQGLGIIDVSDPTNPQEICWHETADRARGIAVQGSHAYLAGGRDGLYVFAHTLTSIEDSAPSAPLTPGIALGPAVPNPFNPRTTIPFELARAARVRLTIHDVTGRRVRVLADHTLAAGRHRFQWDGRSDAESAVASGVYVVRLGSRGALSTRRIALVK